ncbi:unnamed protein product [Effrenium voratum]|nr:unnamed protein product [Effrenium voratum]
MASRVASVLCAACMAVLAAQVLAFTVGQPSQAVSLPRIEGVSAGSANSAGQKDGGAICGAVVAMLAASGLAARSRRRGTVQCNAFSSSSSGFMGTSCASAYITTHEVPVHQPEPRAMSGVASMGMKAQVWWITNTGFDGPKRGGARIFDSRRRESRRRGEELFRHNVNEFEFCVHNLVAAPGSRQKRIQRGRGKYGHHGRTCGYGTTKNGAHKRGRRTLNPGYEGNQKPLHLKTPKLTQEQRDSMKADPFTWLPLKVLNLCEDGDEVDYMDLKVRGLPVPSRRRFDRVKIKGTDEDDEFTVKNLTVYANAFEPAAREKIEKNGGRCIRLTDVGNLPIDARWMSTNEFEAKEDGNDEAAEAEGEVEGEEENPDVKKAKKGPCFHGSKTCRRYFAFGAAHTLWRCPFQRAASDSIAMLWLSQLAVDSTRVVLAQHFTSQLSERA